MSVFFYPCPQKIKVPYQNYFHKSFLTYRISSRISFRFLLRNWRRKCLFQKRYIGNWCNKWCCFWRFGTRC